LASTRVAALSVAFKYANIVVKLNEIQQEENFFARKDCWENKMRENLTNRLKTPIIGVIRGSFLRLMTLEYHDESSRVQKSFRQKAKDL
jgi:hypothetical protein